MDGLLFGGHTLDRLLDQPEEIEGISLEGLVAQHLRAWIAYRNRGERLYFWRTKSGSEVDFVVYGNDCFFAWEVKRSTSAHSVDLRSLKSFRQDYPEAEVVCYNSVSNLWKSIGFP